MKIAFYCGTEGFGGLEMNMLRLAKWMSERGHDILVLATESSALEKELPNRDLNHLILPHHKKYFDFRNASIVKKHLKEHNFEHLIAFDNADLDMLGYTKNFMGNKLKLIYLQQMQMGSVKKGFLHTLRFSKLDAWITLLQNLKNEIATMTHFDMEKVHIIPIGVEVETLQKNMISKNEACSYWDIPNQLTIGILGRIDEFKRQMILVRAVHHLSQKGIDINLLIVGEPTRNRKSDYYEQILEYIKKNNLENKIFIRPFTTEIEKFYSAIDIFAMASSGETYGMVTIESMVMGVPVIGSDWGGTPEILEQGKYGTLFKSRDQEDFEEKLTDMINDFESVKEKAVLAQKHAAKEYSHHLECERIEKLLLSL
jgi:glycosyltransferase involved in cell wall biosynthesis